MGPSPSGVVGWLCGCFVLLFLLPCCAPAFLLALPAPIIYTIAALVPPAVLLSASTAAQQAGTTATAAETTSATAGGGQGDANSGSTSRHSSANTNAHKPLNRHRHTRTATPAAHIQSKAIGQVPVSRPQDASEASAAAPASHDVFSSLAILGSSSASGPPCGVSCSSSNCPWHLPMALSLSTWGQDSSRPSGSRDTSGGGKRPGSTDELLSSFAKLQHAAVELPAFSFPGPAEASTVGLLRSLSAPAAPAGHSPKGELGSPACADTTFAAAASALKAAAASTAVAGIAAEAHSTPSATCVGLQLQHKRVQAEQAASTGPDSPGPFWGSRASALAAAAAAVTALAADTMQAQPAPVDTCAQWDRVAAGGSSAIQSQCEQGSAAMPGTSPGALHKARASTPGRMQSPRLSPLEAALQQQPHWLQAQQQYGGQDGHSTPQAQLQLEVLAVLNHLHDGTQQQQPHVLTVQQESEQGAEQHTPCQSQQQQEQQHLQHLQQPMPTSPMTPVPFIATTTRHSMCMRQPSFRLHASGSPLSTSLSSGGCFSAWVPPLPSPAESPLARRLSERDDTGLPVSSPALQELLSSGGSRRPLRRGGSLDSRRSVSSPGTHACCELDAMRLHQQQRHHNGEQQEAPWAGMQLRSVAHILHQRQQHLQAQQLGAQEREGSPWYRQYQLERRHTFSAAVELSIAADGAVAAVDAATVAATAAAACSGMYSDSGSPPRRQLVWCSSGYGNGSGLEGVGSPGFMSVGSVTPHRLSCCSSVGREQSEGGAAYTVDAIDSDGADATAAVLCDSPKCTGEGAVAVLCSSLQCADAARSVVLIGKGCAEAAAPVQCSSLDGPGAAAAVACSGSVSADATTAELNLPGSDTAATVPASGSGCTEATGGMICITPASKAATAAAAVLGSSLGCTDAAGCTGGTADLLSDSQAALVGNMERRLEKTLTSHCIEFEFSDESWD